MATVPHSPLDLVPVPPHRIFCKACSTIHALRANLCPSYRLDLCPIHKIVFLPNEKSLYQYSHLLDVDTGCPSCRYASEKKYNKALTRSNSCALRPSVTHKDMIFCVYCWAPATKKCDHLACCREHSCVYLRSTVDINVKWWLRPSDFVCHLCPMFSIGQKKAQHWEKKSLYAPTRTLFPADEWDEWQTHMAETIIKLRPGAFQTYEDRVSYSTWMNNIGEKGMLYLRYLAYTGTYPITTIYAETGTIPNTLRVPVLMQVPASDPPPAYAFPTVEPTPAPVATPMPPARPLQATTSMSPAPCPVSSPSNQLIRASTISGAGRRLGDYGSPRDRYREPPPVPPRPSQVQTMHSRGSARHLSFVLGQQPPVTHVSQFLPTPIELTAQPNHGMSQPPVNVPPPTPVPQVTFPSHPPMDPPVNPPIPPASTRRVSFAEVPGSSPLSQHQIPFSPIPMPFNPVFHSPPAPPPSTSPPNVSPAMAQWLAQVRAERAPPHSHHGQRLSTLSIPGGYPAGHPADDDWTTVTDSEDGRSVHHLTSSIASQMPQIQPGQYPGFREGLSYQGGQQNTVYPPFHPSYWTPISGFPVTLGHPFAPAPR